MSIANHKWDVPAQALEFQGNDIVNFVVNKMYDNGDAVAPQLSLECTVISSVKSDEFVGKKTMLYFPFVTKAGQPNKGTYFFLKQFFKDELEQGKNLPYEQLIDKVFSCKATLNVKGDKTFFNWVDYKSLGSADEQTEY